MKLNPHVEVFMRAAALFLGTFFTVGWSKGNAITYDLPLLIVASALGFMLKFTGAPKRVWKRLFP